MYSARFPFFTLFFGIAPLTLKESRLLLAEDYTLSLQQGIFSMCNVQRVVSSVVSACDIRFCVLMYNMLVTQLSKLKADSRSQQ